MALIIKSSVSDISHQSNNYCYLPLLVFIGIFVLFHLITKITFKYQQVDVLPSNNQALCVN